MDFAYVTDTFKGPFKFSTIKFHTFMHTRASFWDQSQSQYQIKSLEKQYFLYSDPYKMKLGMIFL